MLTIQDANTTSPFRIELLDATGRLIMKRSDSEGTKEISTQGLNPGLYVLRKISVDGMRSFKLVIR